MVGLAQNKQREDGVDQSRERECEIYRKRGCAKRAEAKENLPCQKESGSTIEFRVIGTEDGSRRKASCGCETGKMEACGKDDRDGIRRCGVTSSNGRRRRSEK